MMAISVFLTASGVIKLLNNAATTRNPFCLAASAASVAICRAFLLPGVSVEKITTSFDPTPAALRKTEQPGTLVIHEDVTLAVQPIENAAGRRLRVLPSV
jgi:hypothetical protein